MCLQDAIGHGQLGPLGFENDICLVDRHLPPNRTTWDGNKWSALCDEAVVSIRATEGTAQQHNPNPTPYHVGGPDNTS